MRNSGTIIFLIVTAFSTNIAAGGLRSYFNNYNDEMATSTCTALSASHQITGHIAAVRRICGSGPSCADVCKNAKAVPYFSGKFDSSKYSKLIHGTI